MDLMAALIKDHLLKICLLVKFYSILRVTLSGAEFFLNVESLCTDKPLKLFPLQFYNFYIGT